MMTFPDIEPVTPESSSGSYSEDWLESTITVTTDALYKKTRPRTTRMVGQWSFAWVGLSDAEYRAIIDFYRAVGKSEIFALKNWIDGKTYSVRITEKGKWQQYAEGWRGQMTFEEV